MDSIRITVFPTVKRSTAFIVRINPDTNERLAELAEQMEISASRVADYLLNEAMDRVELKVLRAEDEQEA